MEYILNIESSTNICSIAISENDKLLVLHETTTNNHASEITLLIDKCLQETGLGMSQLSAIAISNGPGSYTSLRVGASTAKGLCYALEKPMIAVDTLQALALAAYHEIKDDEAFYCPMIDARRMEVYAAIYKMECGELNEIENMAPVIIDEKSFERYWGAGKRLILNGNGAMKCAPILASENVKLSTTLCSAVAMIPLSIAQFKINNFVDIAYHTPQYLKAPNITTSKKVL